MVAPTDRNLLFGVRALQAGHLDATRFAEACSLWTGQPQTTLAEVLVARGWLTPQQREEIDRQLNPPEAAPPAEVAESDLPLDLTIDEAVERAYPTELTDVPQIDASLLVARTCTGLAPGRPSTSAGSWTRPPPPTTASTKPAADAAREMANIRTITADLIEFAPNSGLFTITLARILKKIVFRAQGADRSRECMAVDGPISATAQEAAIVEIDFLICSERAVVCG